MKIYIILLGLFICGGSLKGKDLNTLAAWSFNEGEGDVFVNSAGSYGSGKLFGDYKWDKGGFISFDGKNSYGLVECATQSGKELKTKSFSVYGRFKLSRLPRNEYFTVVSGLKNNFHIKLHGRKNETWIIVSWVDPETGNRYILTSGSKKRNLMPGEWLQFLFSFEGKSAKLFVNGEADMYGKYYFVAKGAKKGEHIVLDKKNGFPYKGKITLKGLTFGVEKRGSVKRHWLPGSIDCVLLFRTGLGVEDIPYINDLLKKNSSQKILQTIKL
jgi:concanavalin A-like lectin/glucanase superfamily protein